ncbi:MAG: DUF2914 domain-containing protein [Ignavibacteriaceae bacterium]
MRKFYLITLIIVLLLSGGLFAQNKPSIKVDNIAICTSVENRQPIGADSVFSSDAGTLYCFTKLTTQTDTAEISHVWYYEGKEMTKINLPVKAKTWRTWSAKTIMPSWKGNWRVEIEDSNGSVISSLSFRVN